MLTLTLIPNRSTPERYARYINYNREGTSVIPTGINRGHTVAVEWAQIRSRTEPEVDPEFAEAWRAHAATQPELPEAPAITRERLIGLGLIKPEGAPRWKRGLKAVAAQVAR